MISAVTTYSISEEDIRLFGRIVATDLLVEEIFRTGLSGYVMTHTSVDLAHPVVQHVNGRVLDASVEIVVLNLCLQCLVVRIGVAGRVGAARGLDVLHHDPLDLFDVPADRLSGLLVLNKVVEFV